MLRKLAIVGVVTLLTLSSSACAPSATSGRGNQNVITEAELETTSAVTLHEAIQRLRPRWLTVRSSQTLGFGAGETAILVYQNQSRLGGVEILRELDKSVAVWLQYLDGPTASASLPGIGSQDVEGAIIIHTTPRS